MSAQVNFPQLDIDRVTTCIKNAVLRAGNEEEVRMGVSRCIEDEILKPLGISQIGRYEYTLVSGARVDALYGHVIIEYKAPGKLTTPRDIQRAKEQVIGYITKEAGSKQEYSRYLGVIISDRIAFVRYDARTDTWLLRGPYDIRRESIIKLIEALRGLRRKPLAVDHIVRDFGPKSPVTMRMVRILYKKLLETKNARTKILFEDWLRLFKQATGYSPEELEELPQLAKEYGLGGNVQYDALIFSIHTYYALLLKLIAAEIAYLYGAGKFLKSYIAQLDDSYARGGIEELRETLKELEGGGIFKKLLSVENFLEGDYFSWYIDEPDNELGDAISQLIRLLSDYEVATPQLEPEFARDLLKRLYQNLVPSELRHKLGEFYTPDWLANLLLDEVGLSIENLERLGSEDPLKPLEFRVLDPACGSGTFLIHYLSRLRIYAENHHMLDQLLHYVLDNVVGYDMNPLAVLTARTNYLLHIADLLTYASGTIEIPVYLADSIMLERKTDTSFSSGSTYTPTTTYILRTVVGDFKIPASLVQKGYLPNILYEVSKALESKHTVNNFMNRIKAYYTLDEKELELIVSFYEKLLQLEEEKKNNVWVAIIRNAFAPILRGKFDFVVGNPPWINWENLPETYREASKDLWKTYGLMKIKGKTGLGKVKKDLAMLFLARSFDLYLKEGGKLGFLMPFTVFKAQAGAGFREFLASKTRIKVIHDLVTLYPFSASEHQSGAVNRVSAIVVEKIYDLSQKELSEDKQKAIEVARKANIEGVPHVIWFNPSGKPIPPDVSLDEVLKQTRRYNALMVPIDSYKPEAPWMQITLKSLNIVRKLLVGEQVYKAHAGVYTGLNQVYYVQVRGTTPDGKLVITNPQETGQKKKVRQIDAMIEPDLVYPLIRGKDVKKWYISFRNRYIILPVDLQGNVVKPDNMRTKYPDTYKYFYTFFNELVNRSGEPYKSKLEPYRKLPLKDAEKIAPPFYWIFNVKPSLSLYKVVWKRIAGAITGKAVSFACSVIEPIEGKPVIPDDSTILVDTDSPEEAYYLAGFLNSIISRTIIASYTYELRQETHILDFIKVPKFDSKNSTHLKIAELSKRAHELAKCIYAEKKPAYCYSIDAEDELRKVERELDLAVADLLGLSEDDLKEFERLYAILSGEELPVEEPGDVPQYPNVSILNTVIKPGLQSFVEVDVVNPSGEEIEFYYEFPWGSGSFRLVEGKYKINVPPLSPGKYRGVLRWVWRGEEQSKEVVVEVEEHEGPRRPRTLTGI
ncbi:N-6 DNA methylase [Thermofilum sp.]|jgi:type II restriction/modification system DNA methylase subunit YeeA|uniref:Eco57I restriction-modification methylase domain-containing protein n=1 Tax=Thermofilum sp. TaxID=1961369 RepID=UPI0025912104|nr:N-6 DNA methylase [Thermofilum sp.]